MGDPVPLKWLVWDRFLSVDECGANFSLSSGHHDVTHDLGYSVDGSVDLGHGGWGLLR